MFNSGRYILTFMLCSLENTTTTEMTQFMQWMETHRKGKADCADGSVMYRLRYVWAVNFCLRVHSGKLRKSCTIPASDGISQVERLECHRSVSSDVLLLRGKNQNQAGHKHHRTQTASLSSSQHWLSSDRHALQSRGVAVMCADFAWSGRRHMLLITRTLNLFNLFSLCSRQSRKMFSLILIITTLSLISPIRHASVHCDLMSEASS